jgi:hypothetical protein
MVCVIAYIYLHLGMASQYFEWEEAKAGRKEKRAYENEDS